jgi:hypothetical protein
MCIEQEKMDYNRLFYQSLMKHKTTINTCVCAMYIKPFGGQDAPTISMYIAMFT